MEKLKQLLERNREWAAEMVANDPEFFVSLTEQQTPRYLWIGCSDSRVPANQIVGLAPGEMFVHRNVANVVVHTDLNALSVVQYAVDVLKVRHIMVVGHYGCGGVRAADEDARLGLIDNWLRHVHDVRDQHRAELDAIADPAARLDRLCELNVVAQVHNVAQTSTVREAWDRGQPLGIHGWIYRLQDGILRDLGVSQGL
jgi:carbonic anhydrase